MGPDRRETTLHCDSIEQKPDCQISLSAAISDNTSTVEPGVCASKILVSASRFLMRRHRPTPGVSEDGAQAAQLLALGSAGDGAPGLLLISARPAHAAGEHHPARASTAPELFRPHAAFPRTAPSVSNCLGCTYRKITPKNIFNTVNYSYDSYHQLNI